MTEVNIPQVMSAAKQRQFLVNTADLVGTAHVHDQTSATHGPFAFGARPVHILLFEA